MEKRFYNIDEIKRITAAKRDKDAELSVVDPVVARVQKAFDRADLGCTRPHVAEMFNAIFEHFEISGALRMEKDDGGAPASGAMIVPENRCRAHNYPIGKPCLMPLVGDNDRAVRTDGTIGNYLHWTDGLKWRYATDEEIQEWFDAPSDGHLGD